MGAGSKTRRRAARTAAKRASQHPKAPKPQVAAVAPAVVLCERPNELRRARGVWAEPTGQDRHHAPAVDLAADVIGKLLMARQITPEQEQAARSWQNLRAAYLNEIPGVAGYKSCLTDQVPGFDDGDGNPAVIEAYRALEARMTRLERIAVMRTCEDDERPGSLAVLTAALDKIARWG